MTVEDALVSLKQGLELISSAVVGGIVNFVGTATGFWIPSWLINLLLIVLVVFGFWKWLHKMGWVVLGLTALFLASLLMGLFGGI